MAAPAAYPAGSTPVQTPVQKIKRITPLAPPPVVVEDEFNPTRRFGFAVLMIFVFIRLSLFHEVAAYVLHLPTFILLAVGSLTVLFTLLTGGVARAFRHPAASLWCVFCLIMAFSATFSSYIGGSVGVLSVFVKTNLPMYFGIAGMVCTWRECRKLLLVMGWAGIAFVIVTKWLGSSPDGRLEIKMLPSIGNSNDLAAHMLYIFPAMIIMVATPAVPKVFRLLALAFIGGGLYQIMSTGSRGALLGIACGALYVIVRGSAKQKSVTLLAITITAAGLVFTLDNAAIARLASLAASDDSGQDTEAAESKRERTYLLQKSIEFTLTHPLLGVGPGMFGDMNSRLKRTDGSKGSWQVTHNSYTEISSEAGLPALICVIMTLLWTCRSLRKAHLRALREQESEMAFVAFVMAAGIVMCCVTMFFLSMGFRQYFISLTGMGVAMANSIEHELNRKLAERQATAAHPAAAPGRLGFGQMLPGFAASQVANRRQQVTFGR